MTCSMHGKADEDQLLKIKSKLCRPDLTEFVPSDLTLWKIASGTDQVRSLSNPVDMNSA
jgi:hypothetical protein